MLGENDKNANVDRLMQIVTAHSATVSTKNGPVEDELTADKNALAAAKSLYGAHMEFLKRGGDRERGRGGDRNAYACVALTVRDQNAILDRLMQIVSTQTVIAHTKNGPIADEVAADKNSIAAAKFLIGLHAKFRKYDAEDAAIVMLDAHYQKVIVERLMQILNKTFVIRQTKYGPFEDQVIADQNAIRAASVLVSYEGLEISAREGEIGRGGDRETGRSGDREIEMLLRASVASESRFAEDRIEKARPIARIGSSSKEAIPSPCAARVSSGLKVEGGQDAAREEIPSPRPSPDHRSGGAHGGARGQSEIAGCEPDLAPSDLGFTAEDVVREALKIVARDTPDFVDKIDKQALIERVRAKLDRAARESRGISARRDEDAVEQVNPGAPGRRRSSAEGLEIMRPSRDVKVERRQCAPKNLEKTA